eukprot:TRINITY_DN4519_c0_g1_i1.p1 TRINITY_DN4519_c0_g1~~TRINITY_DN4519_c0_g1_i1.p1  ORF type:complete len:300 (+),score=153.75 TRINITY_DN4519_c0_g1_i1:64-900(+)
MEDLVFVGIVALFAVAAVIIYTQINGRKPAPVEIVPSAGSPSKRRPKGKKKAAAEPKKQETFKWDAPEPTQSNITLRKHRDTDDAFDPVKKGEQVIRSVQKRKEAQDQSSAQYTQRQKNKLQSQGFVAVEEKTKKRSKSAEKREDEEEEKDDEYEGMSPERAERLKLLERITSGRRAIGDGEGPRPGRASGGDRPKLGETRPTDIDAVRRRLDDEKREKLERERQKKKAGGGIVAFQGAQKGKVPPWGRAAPPAAEEAAADDEPAKAEPAAEEAPAEE